MVLKGIDKGDIVSSGAPQISKEGSLGRNSIDSTQPLRAKLGIVPFKTVFIPVYLHIF